ncbi:MAG: hypothetical protein ACLVKK_12900 [Ruthenibacterium sp.]
MWTGCALPGRIFRAKLTLVDICRDNLVGRSYLQKVFREKTAAAPWSISAA